MHRENRPRTYTSCTETMTKRRSTRSIGAAMVLLLAVLWPLGASAQESVRAAAVVNDEVISMMDLVMRLRLALLSSGLDDTNENRNRLLRPVLRQLIDESLRLQEAERLDLRPQEEDVRNAFVEVAQQNNLSPERFVELLQQRGILPAAIMDQVRAALTWQLLINRRLLRQVDVTEEDVDFVFDQLMHRQSQRQYRVFELFISFDQPEDEAEALATVEQLRTQLSAGAPFRAIASQFSQSASANRGGDLGWVVPGELPEELDSALAQMNAGDLSPPIRSFGGYYLIGVMDERQGGDEQVERLQLARMVFPVQGSGDLQQVAAQVQQVTAQLDGCQSTAGVSNAIANAQVNIAEQVNPRSLPQEIRTMLDTLEIGQASPIIQTPDGLAVLMVCERQQGQALSKERVERDLEQEQLNILVRRYMRDLRRSANVDIRL